MTTNIQSELSDSESSKYEWNCANEHSLCYVRKESIAESKLWKVCVVSGMHGRHRKVRHFRRVLSALAI